MLSAEQNHKLDTAVHYNIPELQSSSRVPLPQHNGQQEPPAGRKGPPMQEVDQDSEDDIEDDSDEEAEEAPRRQWQGIEAIFEAYQEHIEGRDLWGGVISKSGSHWSLASQGLLVQRHWFSCRASLRYSPSPEALLKGDGRMLPTCTHS